MNKYVFLFFAVYAGLYLHKLFLGGPVSRLSVDGSSYDGDGQSSSSREKLRKELIKESQNPGELTQSFEKIVAQRERLREDRGNLQEGAFDKGNFSFLDEGDGTVEGFYLKLREYSASPEAADYWNQKALLDYVENRTERDQNNLIQIAINVFDNVEMLQEKISDDDLLILKEQSLRILENQISNEQDREKLFEELFKRDSRVKIEQ